MGTRTWWGSEDAPKGIQSRAIADCEGEMMKAEVERGQLPGVVVESLRSSRARAPKIHFIVHEPVGTRIEFAFDPRVERRR